MKGLILFLALVSLTSCEFKPFTGYIVCKEYTPGHMCHDEVPTYSEASLLYVHVPPHVHTHHHTWQESSFIIYVANKNAVRSFSVDSLSFTKYKLLQKVTK